MFRVLIFLTVALTACIALGVCPCQQLPGACSPAMPQVCKPIAPMPIPNACAPAACNVPEVAQVVQAHPLKWIIGHKRRAARRAARHQQLE
jgi:hypothetical protein